MLKKMSAAMLGIALSVSAASAAITVDSGSVSWSVATEDSRCVASSCGVTGYAVSGLAGTSIDDTTSVIDFLSFAGEGTGRVLLSLVASLDINGTSYTTSGEGSFSLLRGDIRHARFAWDSSPIEAEAAGYGLVVSFEEGTRRIKSLEAPVSATIEVAYAPAPIDVAAVPLPASAAALALGMAGLFGYRGIQRRRRAET